MKVCVSRHEALRVVLMERGVIDEDTPVLAHIGDPSVLDGADVIGVLPLHLAARAKSVTELKMNLTMDDRQAMQRGDLSVERTREVAGETITYRVEVVR